MAQFLLHLIGAYHKNDSTLQKKWLEVATATRYKENHSLLGQLQNKNSELVGRPDNHLKQNKI